MVELHVLSLFLLVVTCSVSCTSSVSIPTDSENRNFRVWFLLSLDILASSRKLWFWAFNRSNWACSDTISSSNKAAGYLGVAFVCNPLFFLTAVSVAKYLCIESIPESLRVVFTPDGTALFGVEKCIISRCSLALTLKSAMSSSSIVSSSSDMLSTQR